MTTDIYCWLIELPNPPKPARWMDSALGTWTEDAWRALRFATKATAEEFAAKALGPLAVLPYCVTDHIFIHSCREAT